MGVCSIKKTVILKISDYFKSEKTENMMLYAAVASLFMPFLISCAAIIITVIYALCKKDIRTNMFADKSNIILYILFSLVIIIPLCYQRYISVVAGAGIIIVLLFFLYAKAIVTIEIYNKMLDVAVFSSLFCFSYGIVQKLIMGYNFRVTGGLLNANYYGTMIEFVLIIAFYRIITSKENYSFYSIMILINIIGLFLCDCQSAWLAFIFGILVLLVLNGYQNYAFWFLGASVVFIFIAMMIPGLFPRIGNMPQHYNTRMNIWITSLKGIKAHPLFGQGALTYWFIYKLYNGYRTYHSHSLYIDPILSFGIVGSSLMITYLVIYLKELFKKIKFPDIKEPMTLAIALMVAVCIHGITDIPILWVQTGSLVCVIASAIGISSKKTLDKQLVK